MILQALTRHYEDLASQDKVPRQGWSKVNVSYALTLGQDGQVITFSDITVDVDTGKGKTANRPQVIEVPAVVKRTVGIDPNFLCDNAAYIFGIDSKGNPERSQRCFNEMAALHLNLLSEVDHPAAGAVIAFFQSWDPTAAEDHPLIAPHLLGLKKGGNIVFRFGGEYLPSIAPVRSAWQHSHQGKDSDSGTCLITGEQQVPLARLNPSIKGVRGAQSSGASLVSFNAPAYNSYGKEFGQNAPMGEYATFAYGTALNYLLSDRSHSIVLGDMTIVFWAEGGQPTFQDIFATAIDNDDTKNMTGNDLKAAMTRLARGEPTQWDGIEISPDTPFYILALAPNAARLSVRFFLRNSFGTFAANLLEHQNNLEIVRPAWDTRQQLGFWALLQETVNQNSRDKSPAPVLAGELVRAVLEGRRYPATLLNGVMLRIRAEREITRGRAAIIKAYYKKNYANSPLTECPEEVLTVSLNDSQHIPYRLGRAFSVLEAIQQAANPGINATITDKFFSSASATPATIFPRLINLSQSHLRKLDPRLRTYYTKQLQNILSVVGDKYPSRLTLPEQGSFQLGYYHQTQNRYEKKEDNTDV